MKSPSAVEIGAWYLGLILCLALLGRILFQLRLARRYRALSLFLLVSALRSILLASLPLHRSLYAQAYFLTAPVLYACHAWVVFELYSHVFDAYRGIAAFSRWAIAAALLLGAAAALATSLWDHNPAREPFPLLGLFLQAESIVLKILLAFLLFMSAILLWFPIPQRWNVVCIGLGVTAITLANTAAWIVRGLNPSAWTRAASSASLYVFAVCMGLWLFLLKPKERDLPRIEAVPATAGMETFLLARLRSMNQTLESLRKSA